MKPSSIEETQLNLISENTRIEGTVTFDHLSRICGVIAGEVQAKEGSTLVLQLTAVVEGNIHADTLMIDGYVRGNIVVTKRVFISRTGRVVGNIHTPILSMEFGAYFEGQCTMPPTLEVAAHPATSVKLG